MLRLTLRTLLAYLDDTLEPMEIKTIGQKVAESDTAQELIARIKQITRRRRLTTPPASGPGAFDPNTVAEYLDNELSSEHLAELEKICLESDVHLAEIASCHQILTLVLGEPALVPPTAKERMYALVQGREAIPFRKASAISTNASGPTNADADADEMFLLGLPFYRRGTWLRWALPLAGVVLIAVLGVALWQAFRDVHPAQVVDASKSAADRIEEEKNRKIEEEKNRKIEEEKNRKIEEEKNRKIEEEKNRKIEEEKNKVKTPVPDPIARKAPPLTERVEVGRFHFDPKGPPSLLVQRKASEEGWHRLQPQKRVSTNDRLMSLPGYASEVRLDSGVRLLLRGHIREFSMFPEMDYLQESAVVLHKNPQVDADVTLERGRLYVSNHKDSGPAVVRLRFNREVWDLTLREPQTEVVVDLLRRYRSDINYLDGEEPLATLHLLVLHGKASLAIDYNHYPDLSAPPGPAHFQWDNKGAGARGPSKVEQKPQFFDKVLPVPAPAEPMNLALKEISLRMLADKKPSVVLEEVLQKSDNPAQHLLAIYCLGALDEVKKLIGILGDTDEGHFLDRDTAIFTLRRWLGRDAAQGPLLYDEKNKSGLLLSNPEYRGTEAEAIYLMLHDFSEEARANPETYELLSTYLASEKVAIAELARYHLYRLTLGVKIPSLAKFNAAAPPEDRKAAASDIKRLIVERKLPPGTGQPMPKPGPEPAPPPKK